MGVETVWAIAGVPLWTTEGVEETLMTEHERGSMSPCLSHFLLNVRTIQVRVSLASYLCFLFQPL